MCDRLLDFTFDLVEALKAVSTFAPAATFAWIDDPGVELDSAALGAPLVWVIDAGEVQKTVDGTPVEEFTVGLVFQRKIDRTKEKSADVCRQMSGLVSQVTQFCRKNVVAGANCCKTERLPAREWVPYHDDGLYQAEVTTDWRRVWDGDE